jgi:hypothetical protein
MWALRIVFLLAVVLAAATVLGHGRWEGRYSSGPTWIIHLKAAPSWDPPTIPTYERFRATFDDLPENQQIGASITRILKWEWIDLDFLLYFWGIAVVISVVYLSNSATRRDPVLHVALCMAAGLTGSALTCVLCWVVFGGWGPPWPLHFGIAGLILGPIIGLRKYTRTAN